MTKFPGVIQAECHTDDEKSIKQGICSLSLLSSPCTNHLDQGENKENRTYKKRSRGLGVQSNEYIL